MDECGYFVVEQALSCSLKVPTLVVAHALSLGLLAYACLLVWFVGIWLVDGDGDGDARSHSQVRIFSMLYDLPKGQAHSPISAHSAPSEPINRSSACNHVNTFGGAKYLTFTTWLVV